MAVNLRDAVNKYLLEYQEECSEALEETLQEVGKEAVKMLKSSSPVGRGPKAGAYAKGWAMKTEKKRLGSGVVIYGRNPTYRLAHLLEKGHPIKRGGRTVGSAAAQPHISAVHDWAVDECVDRVIQKMEAI